MSTTLRAHQRYHIVFQAIKLSRGHLKKVLQDTLVIILGFMPFSRDRVLRENLLDGPLTFRSADEINLSKAETSFSSIDQKSNMLIVTYRMVSIMGGPRKDASM